MPTSTERLIDWYNAAGERWCTGCHAYMEVALFHRNRASTAGDGLQRYCKLCATAYRRQTYERNSEREKAYARAWQQAHPERTRINARRAYRVYYRLHIKPLRQQQRRVREAQRRQREELAG